MLDLQYIYDICAKNDIEIISDKSGVSGLVGAWEFHSNWLGRNQAGYVREVRKIILGSGVPYDELEATLLHELGHGLGRWGHDAPPPCMTSELAANKWAIANYQGSNLAGLISFFRDWLNSYTRDGLGEASYRSELEPTAITLGIADAIAWRD